MSDHQPPLRVTLEELADAARTEAAALVPAGEQPAIASPGAKSYGNINATPDAPALFHEKASILLQAWFYSRTGRAAGRTRRLGNDRIRLCGRPQKRSSLG